jgi:hypothetical protein
MGITLLVLALAAQGDVDASLRDFSKEMREAKDDDARIAAIEKLAETNHFRAGQKLIQIIARPYATCVRVAAAEEVRRIGDPKLAPSLVSVLGSFGALLASANPKTAEQQEVAEAVVRALGACRSPKAVPLLVRILTKSNIPLITEAVRALALIRDPACLDQLVRLHYAASSAELGAISNPRKSLAPHTLMALRRITGEKFVSGERWRDWWKGARGRFRPPPEETLGGLPPDIRSFAVYSGGGEVRKLRQYDLVLVDPSKYTKEELARFRAVAISGDPAEALKKGCVGFVVDPTEAAGMRKKHPKALLIARGGDSKTAPHVHAMLLTGIDPKTPDVNMFADLKKAYETNDTATLAVFFVRNSPAEASAREHDFLIYTAPDKDFKTLP